jgi:hypothetical protein
MSLGLDNHGRKLIPMRIPLDRRSLALVVLALVAPAAASADTKAVYQSAKGKESLTFAVKGPMIRWDAPEFARDKRYALYDSTRGTMIVVDDGRKELMEMTPESMRRQREQMQAQIGPMMEQLKKQMKNLPAEQRRAIEQKLPALQQGAGGIGMTFTTKAAGSGTVNGMPCQRMSVLRDGEAVHELCLASRADAKIPADDYETMQKMFETMRQMASAVSASSLPMATDLKGVPIQMKNHMDGSVQTLKQVSTETLPASVFTLPPYKKVSFGSFTGLP